MAEASTPVVSLPDAQQAAAVAPNFLGAWSFFQREVNVILPLRLREAQRILNRVDALLSGRG